MSAKATQRVLDEAHGVRSMVWVIAIMLFLTVLGAAFGLAMRNAAQALQTQLIGRATVLVVRGDPAQRAAEAARALAAVRTLPGVARAAPVDREDLAELLRPWLGDDGADPDLPMPAMIDLDLASDDEVTVARVRAAVRRAAPHARVDAHEAWMAPVAGFLDLVVALAVVLVALMATATAAVVVLAARAGLDAHRPTIEVMHMLGSTDVQVARLFQRRIARDATIGAMIGGILGLGTVVLVGARAATLGSELLGGATLGRDGWLVLAVLPFGFIALAAVAARLAITRVLGRVL